VFFIISYVFSVTKLEKKRVEQVLPGSGKGSLGGREEVAQTMYARVSKCKHDKIKETNKAYAHSSKNHSQDHDHIHPLPSCSWPFVIPSPASPQFSIPRKSLISFLSLEISL
jgi:hypothetical protein